MPQPPKVLDDSASMSAWFGVELRNWRNQRKLSQKELGAKVHVSGAFIGKIEKAERPCPDYLVDGMDAALGAGGALRRLWHRVKEEQDAQRADADKTSAETGRSDSSSLTVGMLLTNPLPLLDRSLSPMERRALLAAGGIAALASTALTDLIPPLGHTPLPRIVGRPHIEQVRTASTTLETWDNRYGGGGIVREAAIGQLNWATRLLHVTCPPELQPELFTAVGQLATVMGASAFDAYEHDDARRLLQFATACAEAAGNWHLRANTLDWRARQEIWCGSPDLGLTHAENGLVRSDRLTPREQAMLHNVRARALAKMGRVQETLTAVGQSDDVFSRAKPDEDASWMAFYDNAQHHGDTGHALYDIAVLAGHCPRMAAERLHTAITEHTPAYVRSRALSGTKLASLTMATGDPHEAVAIGHRALDEAGQLHSRRAADEVADLLRIAGKHSRRPEVADLRERIATTVLAS
jgi:transcriptional regulator with XRE-family HTH domain